MRVKLGLSLGDSADLGTSRRIRTALCLCLSVGIVACGQPVRRDVDPDPSASNIGLGAGLADPGPGNEPTPVKPTSPGSNSNERVSAERLLEELSGPKETSEGKRKREHAVEKLLEETSQATSDPPSSSAGVAKTNEPLASRDVHSDADGYRSLIASGVIEKSLPGDHTDKGLDRTRTDHWKGSLFGVPAEVASAEYKHRSSGRIDLQVSDLGHECTELTSRALEWHNAAQAARPPDGLSLERAKIIDGHSAFMRYDGIESTCSLEVVVRGRFHFYAAGRMVHLSTLDSLFRSIDFDSLGP